MTSLPIFRFPQLIYIKIINSMDPAEQFLTALCSRKAYSLVKNHRSKAINLILYTDPYRVVLLEQKKQALELFIGSESYWSSEKEGKAIYINENCKLRCSIASLDRCDSVVTCWKDRSVGLRNMLELACNIFRIVHVKSVEIQGPEDTWIVDWLKKSQKTVKTIYFMPWSQNAVTKGIDDAIKRVILNCTVQRLFINAKPTDDFQVQTIANTFGLFSCSHGFWFTIDNLIELDCIELRISRKYFTTQEVNQFLKHWINGGSSRLKFLRIGIEEYNQDEVVADIQNHVTRVPGDRVYTSPYNTTWCFNGLQLLRNDGVTTSIQYVPFGKILHFGVWPDANKDA